MWPILLFLISHSYAQVRLNPLEVTAPGPLLDQVSTPVWHASESEMQSSTQLQDLLSQSPGVTLTQSGGVGSQSSIFIRGSESRHTLVLTDGMRLNDPSSTSRGFDSGFTLTPFFQDLLLLQGPSPVLYGGDATSGVIELVPRRGHQPRETVIGLGAGSFDTVQGFATVDWGSGNHQGTFGLAHVKTQGFSRLNKKRFNTRENDGAENTHFMQASRHKWNSSISTDILVYGLTGIADQDDFFNGVDSNEFTANKQGTLVQTTRGIFSHGDWWIKTGIVSQQRDLHLNSGNSIFEGQTRDSRGGVRYRFEQWETLAGLGIEQEWIGTPDFKANNDLGHAFLMERYYLNKWLFEIGGRGEHHQRYGNFFAYEGVVKHQTTETLSWYSKFARGYKSPSLYQLYAPATFGGNSNLTPEFNNSFEGGLNWKREGELSLVYFQQDFKNFIQYDFTNGYFNSGTLRVQGTEATALTPEHNWGQLKLSGTVFSYSNYDARPLRRPPYVATLQWIGSWAKWTTTLSGRFVGDRKDTDNKKMESYEVIGANIKYASSENQEWSLQMGNITDRNYEDIWGYSVAPANVALHWLGRY